MSTTVREEYEVGDLDPVGVLEAAAEAEQSRTRAAFRKLQLAAHWADLHPATADTGVETFGGAALLADESLGGDGTPAVAAFTPEPFALALGMSPSAGAQLIADALDLRHRLPLLWKRVGRLEVPAWQARRVARQTHRLSKAAAIWVDEQLADRGTCGPVIVDRLVAHAIAIYDPEDPRGPRERRPGRLGRHPDPPRGHRLPRHLPPRSHRRHPGPESVLRPGLCGRPPAVPRRRHLTRSASARSRPSASSPANPQRPASRRSRCTPASTPATSSPTPSPSARSRSSAPPPSPRSATWVGHHQVVIQPVLNMARRDAVDSHDPPGWMRDLVHPPRRPLHLPEMPGRRQVLRPRPHHPLRRERTTRPNQGREPRLPLPATPPRQDHRSLVVPPHARRRLPMARAVRRDLPRHRPRHPTRPAGRPSSPRVIATRRGPEGPGAVARSPCGRAPARRQRRTAQFARQGHRSPGAPWDSRKSSRLAQLGPRRRTRRTEPDEGQPNPATTPAPRGSATSLSRGCNPALPPHQDTCPTAPRRWRGRGPGGHGSGDRRAHPRPSHRAPSTSSSTRRASEAPASPR